MSIHRLLYVLGTFLLLALSSSACEHLVGASSDVAELDSTQETTGVDTVEADVLEVEQDAPDMDDPGTDAELSDSDVTDDVDAELADEVQTDPIDEEVTEVPSVPVLYRADELLSPITPYVVEQMLAIYDRSAMPDDLVFMKVGASGTVSTNLLYCFSGRGQYIVDLDGRDELWTTIEYFRQGDADGTTPFDRETLAARVGHSASWAIGGNPSPLEQEIAAINPRFALVNYGTNDMGMGTTYRSALFPYYENMSVLLDQVTEQGIIPIVAGLNPRGDSASAALWVPTYNTVTRGMAQARQVPYINQYLAVKDLPDQGLVSDGLHGNVYRQDSRGQGCIFTSEALQFNYNVRNLLSIQVLDHMVQTVILGEPAPDYPYSVLVGDGSPESPFLIDELPLTHFTDTRISPHTNLDAYPTCDTGQDESGPEFLYELQLDERTPIRAIVLVRDGVDVDLHLLEPPFGQEDCLDRHDKILELTLDPGTYLFSLDTYVTGSGTPRPGEYLFVILDCEEGDPDCD